MHFYLDFGHFLFMLFLLSVKLLCEAVYLLQSHVQLLVSSHLSQGHCTLTHQGCLLTTRLPSDKQLNSISSVCE